MTIDPHSPAYFYIEEKKMILMLRAQFSVDQRIAKLEFEANVVAPAKKKFWNDLNKGQMTVTDPTLETL